MLERKRYRVAGYEQTKKDILAELEPDATASDALNHLLGYYDDYGDSKYTVRSYVSNYTVRSYKNKRKFIHRLNTCWVYPIFFITIPFQYLCLGRIGVNANTKLGSFINWLVKFDD